MAGKEYTTAPILVNADGHPIPQYLDITDTTDSPQGTFKPLTQLQAEHPDVQNVQLTGSRVEIQKLAHNVTLAPGSTWSYDSFIDLREKQEHAFLVALTQEGKLMAYIEAPGADSGDRSSNIEIETLRRSVLNRPRYIKNSVFGIVTGFIPRVENTGDEDARLDLWIITRG